MTAIKAQHDSGSKDLTLRKKEIIMNGGRADILSAAKKAVYGS